MDKKEPQITFRAKEPKSKPKVWVPPGARTNDTALPSDPPYTEYDDVAQEWVEKLKKKYAEEKGS